MATPKSFLYANFQQELQQFVACGARVASWPPIINELLPGANDDDSTAATAHALSQLLVARKAVWQAASDTDMVAAELRRYQKFAKPGRPSPHIVQLRQQQAAARQASSQSRQALIQAAAAWVREAGLDQPVRVALEPFINAWMEANLPQDAGASAAE